MSSPVKVAVLATGNELLSGTTLDTHSRTLSQWALLRGLEMTLHLSIGDDLKQLLWGFRECSAQADLVFVVGGLGPTVDDLTQPALAEFAGVELFRHDNTVAQLEAAYLSRGLKLHPNNLKQADFPIGSEILFNPIGTAPGFSLMVGGTRFVCLPGVPREFTKMLEEQVNPRLAQWFEQIVPSLRVVMKTYGKTESGLDRLMKGIEGFPSEVTVGFRTQFPENDVILTAAPEHEDKLALAHDLSLQALGALAFSDGPSIGQTMVNLLRERGLVLGVAESCTGGLLGSILTSVPGSSDVFDGGTITYSNEAKTAFLNVPKEILDVPGGGPGAVSQECARAMAEGLRTFRATPGEEDRFVTLSITGIAGPGGGSPEKPVGTVWIGLSGPWGTEARRFHFKGDRDQVRALSARSALELCRRQLLDLPLDISSKGNDG